MWGGGRGDAKREGQDRTKPHAVSWYTNPILLLSRVQPKAKQLEIKQTRLFGSSKPGQAHSLPAEAVATPIKLVQLNIDTAAAK